MSAVYLNAMGIVCAAGCGADEVAGALFGSAPANPPDSGLFPGRPLVLGQVRAALPDMDDLPVPLRGRNGALLRSAWEQIAAPAAAAMERYGPARVAVVVGTSTSGIGEAERALPAHVMGVGWGGFDYGQQEMAAPAHLLRTLAQVRGPAWTLSTACSSSAKALASGARLLRAGLVDAVIAGGGDSLCRFTVAGFSALESVAVGRCNPFSRNRCGINIGEGAALFLMTREPGPVRLSGWGESADAYHLSAPAPDGVGAMGAMRQALVRAQLAPHEVDYVNLHGTATAHNDAMESRAMAGVFGAGAVAASSTKPLTGHALGAAGAIEAALCWLVLACNPRRALPPHWWDGEADPDLPVLDLVKPGFVPARTPRHLLSHSFAFGGSNAVLAFSGE